MEGVLGISLGSDGSEGSEGSAGSEGACSERSEGSERGGELLQLRPVLDQDSVLTDVVV